MAISSLNYDVLYGILAFLNSHDLAKLARSCRYLAPVVQEHLYQKVKLYFCRHDRRSITSSLLSRTLNERPIIRDLVRHVNIRLLGETQAHIQHAHSTLLLLRRVHSVKFSVSGSQSHSNVAGSLLASTIINLPCLRQLHFKWQPSTKLPTIRTPPLEASPISVPLRKLLFPTIISLAAFDQLLRPLHSLESLRCSLPGTPMPAQSLSMMDQLSPRQIVHCLEPAKMTLTKLNLWGSSRHWPTNDGSRLDLSTFRALRTLRVPHFLLFYSPHPCPSRNGVYLLLPPSLEHLEVRFGLGASFLYNSSQQEDGFERRNRPVSAYGWLTELCQHKAESLPNLRTIHITEITVVPDAMSAGTISSLSVLSARFAASGVELKVQMRK